MYIEAKDVAIQFKKELVELLKKYDSEIEIVNLEGCYDVDDTMEVYIPGVFDKEGNCIAESATIDLGRCADKNL